MFSPFVLFVVFYGGYLFLSALIAYRQIAFVKHALHLEPLILDKEGYEVAGRYAIVKEKLTLAGLVIDGVMFCFWVFFGFSALASLTSGVSQEVQALLFLLSFLAVTYLVGLPLEYIKKFVVDEKFGFNRSSLSLFLKDQVKTVLLTALFGGGVIYLIAMIISTFPSWWIIAFLLSFLLVGLISILYPTVIAPLFNTFSPLEEGALKERVTALLRQYDYDANGVFVVDASQRDARLNAYFGGLGKAKRVALFDTLIQKLTVDEIEAVLAHELGHATHGDIYKQLMMSGVMLFSFFAFFGVVTPLIVEGLSLPLNASTLMGVSLLSMSPLSFFVMPLVSYVSRRNEFAADAFAAEGSTRAEELIGALQKLVTENKSFPRSDRWTQVFYHTHPTVVERIERLRATR